MTDTTEVEKWRPVHGGDAWVRVTEYDDLAAKLAEVEAELANGSFYQEKDIDALQARAEAAEAALVAAYRLALDDAAQVAAGIASQYVGYMSRVEKAIRALPTPTAAKLMARIQTGEKK